LRNWPIDRLKRQLRHCARRDDEFPDLAFSPRRGELGEGGDALQRQMFACEVHVLPNPLSGEGTGDQIRRIRGRTIEPPCQRHAGRTNVAGRPAR
jgi:hypothetical protein